MTDAFTVGKGLTVVPVLFGSYTRPRQEGKHEENSPTQHMQVRMLVVDNETDGRSVHRVDGFG